eukprot:622878-Alexandrium_andersonii.AAC.1
MELPRSNAPPADTFLGEVSLDLTDAERASATPLKERPNSLPEVAILNEVPWVTDLAPPHADQATPQTDNRS